MNEILKMDDLLEVFSCAKMFNAKFIGVVIEMDGFPKNEVIINAVENVDEKMAYYEKTYDENLNHKFAPGIKIKMFWMADTIESLANFLENYM